MTAGALLSPRDLVRAPHADDRRRNRPRARAHREVERARAGRRRGAAFARPPRRPRSAARRDARSRCAARRRSATRSSTKRCRRCRTSAPAARGATPTASTGSATIFSSSTTRERTRAQIVGTYRLLRHEIARAPRRLLQRRRVRHRAAPCAQVRARFLELGRSCVLPRLSQQAGARASVARGVGLRAHARHRRDARLREPRRHRPGAARAAAFVPASPRAASAEWRVRALPRATRVAMDRAAARQRSTRGRRSARCRRSSKAICGSARWSATAPSSTVSSARPTS